MIEYHESRYIFVITLQTGSKFSYPTDIHSFEALEITKITIDQNRGHLEI